MATYGLRVKRADGSIETDVSYRLSRVIDRLYIPGGSDGAVFDSRLVGRAGFAQVYPSAVNTFNMLIVPDVVVSPDGYIRWTYGVAAEYRYPCMAVYGVLG
ncbi:hypothetical protein BN2910_51780 [Achromobacter xylosoxidans]|nr:hypothetical protein BN2910_51780 [Achromobacter xylosoxidans]